MRREIIKKLVSIIFSLSLIFGLVGCSVNDTKGSVSNQLGKHNVYSYIDIPLEIGVDNYTIRSLAYRNDKVIIGVDLNISNDELDITELRTDIFCCNIDGSDLQRITLQENLQEDSRENVIIYRDNNQMILCEDGNVLAVQECLKKDFSNPDYTITENWKELKCWNEDGTLGWAKQLDELKTNPEDDIYIHNMFRDSEGNIYLYRNNDVITLLSSEGNIIKPNILDDVDHSTIAIISNVYLKNDNEILILHYNDDWTKLYASIYNQSTNILGEKQEITINLTKYEVMKGITSDLILYDKDGIYRYNIGDTEVKTIMNSINSNLATSGFINVSMIDNNQFIGAYRELPDNNKKIGFFTKIDPKDIPDKKVLVLGVNSIDRDLAKRVVDFNKESEIYRITVRDYSTYNTMEDDSISFTQMYKDIISGNIPDMLAVDRTMPISEYISNGLLADIGELIEQDDELSQEEFMENVFQAYHVNDKLYHIIPSYSVYTVNAKKSIVGDRIGWTMEEMLTIMNELPEGSRMFDVELTRSAFMQNVMAFCGSDFINISTGECRLDSEEFMKYLELAKTFPEEIDESIYEDDLYWESYDSRYREGLTVLMDNNMGYFSGINYTINGHLLGDFTFVGFPNENRNGSVINVYHSYVIYSKSPNIDGAWEFMRYYLTDEYQESLQYALPVNREIFLSKAQKATEIPYYIDENGKKVESKDNFYMNTEIIPLDSMTQEQVDRVVNFIESVDRPFYDDAEVLKIIEEEAAPFFLGQKNVKEVAEIIQNRVQLYVNEHR